MFKFFLSLTSWGAESVPKKNFLFPEHANFLSAIKSFSSLTTGIQKWYGLISPLKTSFFVNSKWCKVIVDARFEFDSFSNEYKSNLTSPYAVEFGLAYPNPFNPITSIDYTINKPTNIKITIFDVTGRLIKVIENGYKGIGDHVIRWNAENHSSGIYYIQIHSDHNIEMQKVVLLK